MAAGFTISGQTMNDRAHVHTLTPRQLEVLELVAQGLTNIEIGRQLSIDERTARSHVVQIFSKIGVSNRTEAARWVWERHQLKPSSDIICAMERLANAVRERDIFGFLTNEVQIVDQWVSKWSAK
jgi:DNA-binding CsgD family transcriptional regulator